MARLARGHEGPKMRNMAAIGVSTLLALGTIPPAAARPLPKAEPAPKMRDCPEVGDGYVRLPDSDSCVKIGGILRVEVMKQSLGGSGPSGGR